MADDEVRLSPGQVAFWLVFWAALFAAWVLSVALSARDALGAPAPLPRRERSGDDEALAAALAGRWDHLFYSTKYDVTMGRDGDWECSSVYYARCEGQGPEWHGAWAVRGGRLRVTERLTGNSDGRPFVWEVFLKSARGGGYDGEGTVLQSSAWDRGGRFPVTFRRRPQHTTD